jgi:hypothetical protein
MLRLFFVAGIGIALYFGLRRLSPGGSVSVKQWLAAVAAVVLVFLYVRSPIDLIPDGTPVGFLDDLLVAAGAYMWLRRRLGLERPAAAPGERRHTKQTASKPGWDPYAVLGVDRGASQDDIARAYRAQMKRYHPDRVDDLGEELQRVAHEKTLAIQRAYEELREKPRAATS